MKSEGLHGTKNGTSNLRVHARKKSRGQFTPVGFRLLVRIAFPELELAIRVSKPIYIDIADLAPRLYALK